MPSTPEYAKPAWGHGKDSRKQTNDDNYNHRLTIIKARTMASQVAALLLFWFFFRLAVLTLTESVLFLIVATVLYTRVTNLYHTLQQLYLNRFIPPTWCFANHIDSHLCRCYSLFVLSQIPAVAFAEFSVLNFTPLELYT